MPNARTGRRGGQGLSGKLPSSRPAKPPKIARPRKARSDLPSTTVATPRTKGLSEKLGAAGGGALAKQLGSVKGPQKTKPRRSAAKSAPLSPPAPAASEQVAAAQPVAGQVLDRNESSLLDIVDNLLNQGVVLSGDAVIGVADVDLIYLRLSAVLGAADKILGPERLG